MATWLLKTEPAIYSWEKLAEDTKARWDGVRNYPSRNHIRAMKPGDLVFIFDGGDEQMVSGLGRVASEPYDDPSSDESKWSVVDIEAVLPLTRPVSWEEIRNTYLLNVMPMITQTRLTVQPVTDVQRDLILKIAKTELPA
ncbi:EVE domain-containing protein [Patescibacteria group bacterium]|nr:EVE domain-containing protein [Patescibacteria group bacterium]MBU2612981.1 EVE domain-containing protein [Patescibacteria group bacterium]